MCLWHKRQVLIEEMISQKKFRKRDYFCILVETSIFFVISTHILFILSNLQFSMLISMQRTFLLILCSKLLVPPDQAESWGQGVFQ